jgi:hypothetical protein
MPVPVGDNTNRGVKSTNEKKDCPAIEDKVHNPNGVLHLSR